MFNPLDYGIFTLTIYMRSHYILQVVLSQILELGLSVDINICRCVRLCLTYQVLLVLDHAFHVHTAMLAVLTTQLIIISGSIVLSLSLSLHLSFFLFFFFFFFFYVLKFKLHYYYFFFDDYIYIFISWYFSTCLIINKSRLSNKKLDYDRLDKKGNLKIILLMSLL